MIIMRMNKCYKNRRVYMEDSTGNVRDIYNLTIINEESSSQINRMAHFRKRPKSSVRDSENEQKKLRAPTAASIVYRYSPWNIRVATTVTKYQWQSTQDRYFPVSLLYRSANSGMDRGWQSLSGAFYARTKIVTCHGALFLGFGSEKIADDNSESTRIACKHAGIHTWIRISNLRTRICASILEILQKSCHKSHTDWNCHSENLSGYSYVQ